MTKNLPIESEFIFYTTPNGEVKLQVIIRDENIWLTQKRMSELFGVDITTINEHIKNIYKTNELDENSTIGKFQIVQMEGKREVKRTIYFYNLDAILSVGYRVNSKRSTQFRIWATKTLKEFMIKGFVLDDERLKRGGNMFNKDYFEELLGRIREIRASERRFYLKITDIFSLSVDYDKTSETAKKFFAKIQNKFHWAITKNTSAELIKERANSAKINLGLTNISNKNIRKTDLAVGKNYLTEDEITELELLVNTYLDLIELRIKRKTVFAMKDWENLLDDLLTMNSYPILINKGKVKMAVAKAYAEGEFEKYKKKNSTEFLSDFEEFAKQQLN